MAMNPVRLLFDGRFPDRILRELLSKRAGFA
jgi:hypothetical protein